MRFSLMQFLRWGSCGPVIWRRKSEKASVALMNSHQQKVPSNGGKDACWRASKHWDRWGQHCNTQGKQVFTVLPGSGQCVQGSEDTRSGGNHHLQYYSWRLWDPKSFSLATVQMMPKRSLTSKVYQNYAMAVSLKFRKQWVYSALQSSHWKEKVTFSSWCHPGTLKYPKAQQKEKKKKIGPWFYRSALGLLCYVDTSSSEWRISVQSNFFPQWGNDNIIMRLSGDICRLIASWLFLLMKHDFATHLSFTLFPAS